VLDEFQRTLGGELFVAVLLGQIEDGGLGRVREIFHQVDIPALDGFADHFEFHGGLAGVLILQERDHPGTC
jgi:hypothetical protein